MKTAILFVALMVGVAEAGDTHYINVANSPDAPGLNVGASYLDMTNGIFYCCSGKKREMCDPAQELIAAAEGVLPYLDNPNYRPDSYSVIHPVVRPMPTELELAEQEVERLKKKAKAIRRFRDALKKAGGR